MNKVRILREFKNIKKNQKDVKNIITEILKYILVGINNRITRAKE